MKSAIIFGGSGFIGSHLLRSLLVSGQYGRLTSVDRVEPAKRLDGVDYRLHDVRDAIPLDFGDSFDEAYNLAAIHRTPGHAPHEYYETNVAGAINVCDFAERKSIPLVVFTSSIAVYGPGEDLKLETTPTRASSDYGRSKLLAERLHRRWQEGGKGRRLIVVRPAVVFGPGENGNFTRLAAALERRFFFFPGRRDTIKSCGYVEELLASIAFTVDRPDDHILYNFCFPTPYTIEDICAALQDVAGLPAPRGLLPRSMLDSVALAFETADRLGLRNGMNRERIAKLVNSTYVRPGYLLEQGYAFKADLRQAFALWLAESRDGRLA